MRLRVREDGGGDPSGSCGSDWVRNRLRTVDATDEEDADEDEVDDEDDGASDDEEGDDGDWRARTLWVRFVLDG